MRSLNLLHIKTFIFTDKLKLKSILLNWSILLLVYPIYGQDMYLSSGSNGMLTLIDYARCCKKDIKEVGPAVDLAVTPSGRIFLIQQSLNEFDIAGNLISSIATSYNNGTPIYGAGLLALDDNFLLMDYYDSLVKIDIQTGLCSNLGYTGSFCAGDFAKAGEDYFMVTANTELLKFTLDPSDFSIQSSQIVGTIESGNYPVYGLFNIIDPLDQTNSLYCIIMDNVYEIDTANAQINFTCNIEGHYSLGAASYSSIGTNTTNVGSNIITPNGDAKNDYLIFDQTDLISVQVFNRWGITVFESTSFPCVFEGKSNLGEQLTDGVYYYIVKDTFCDDNQETRLYELTIYK